MTDETPKLGWTTDAPDRFHELHIGFKGVDYTVELGDDGIWSTTFGGEWYPGYEAIEGGEGSDLAKVQAACEAHHVAQMLARGYVPVEDLTAAKNAIQEFLAARDAVISCPVSSIGIGQAFDRHDAAIQALRSFMSGPPPAQEAEPEDRT